MEEEPPEGPSRAVEGRGPARWLDLITRHCTQVRPSRRIIVASPPRQETVGMRGDEPGGGLWVIAGPASPALSCQFCW